MSSLSFAQYYNERLVAENFEYSNLYFNSYYLNPYGLAGFKEMAAGFIADPFLSLKINPANLPEPGSKDVLFYLDFRGDWADAEYTDGLAVPTFDLRVASPYYYGVDRRWNSVSKTEPEPIVAFGIILRPLSEITNRLYLSGSYEYLRKNENFNDFPYNIYYYNFYYDAFGVRALGVEGMPVIDRYGGVDEMTNSGHLFSLFAGFDISDDIKAGIGMNGVFHSREGEFSNSYRDQYSSSGVGDWVSKQSTERNQDYQHLDFTAGIKYLLTKTLSLGLKAGMLNGKAEQSYSTLNYYFSKNNKPDTSTTWYYYFFDGTTEQTWNLDGTTTYFGFDFQKSIQKDKWFSGYYQFSSSGLDLSTSSMVTDTNQNSSRWQYTTDWYLYKNFGAARDYRSGIGDRDIKSHEGVLNLRWNLSDKTTLSAGIFFRSVKTIVTSREPAKVYRVSENRSYNSNNYNYYSYMKLIEDKTLVWDYQSEFTTLQIPVLITHLFDEKWEMLYGIARVSNAWNIEETTTAYFAKRETVTQDTSKLETNFGERYESPDKKITEDFIKFLVQFKLSITKDLNARVMFEPSFDPYIRFAQWWLAFEAKF